MLFRRIMRLCMGLNGTNCPDGWEMDPGDTLDLDGMQDVKSIKLEP